MRANHPLLWLVVVAVIAAIAYGSGKFDAPPPRRPNKPVRRSPGAPRSSTATRSKSRARASACSASTRRKRTSNAATRAGCDYPCGRAATRALAALTGARVSCTLLTHDRYERDVATCMANGRDLGDAMVRAGHALDYARHSGGRYAEAEREARAARRGIWAGTFEEPEAWRREMRSTP